MLAITNIPCEVHQDRSLFAFLSSAAAIVFLLAMFGLSMFPELIHGRPDAGNSLTAFNARSSLKRLPVMLVMAVIGIPLVLGFMAYIYREFRGKVKLDSISYWMI